MKSLVQKSLLVLILIISTQLVLAETHLKIENLSLKNAAQFSDNLITGGQPSLDDLKLLKAMGIQNVINLRSKGEFNDFNEPAVVNELGMHYTQLEIAGASGITLENASQLHILLTQLKGKTLLHCASSNRVGALLAISAKVEQGKSTQAALIEGQKAGLKSLYSKTETILNHVEK